MAGDTSIGAQPVAPLTPSPTGTRKGVAVVIVALLVAALILIHVAQSLAGAITQLSG